MLNNVGTFITFGNVHKKFPRMAQLVIDNHNLLPKPIVIQAGPNIEQFENFNYKVFKYCEINEFNEYISNSSLIISHAGVGAVSTSIRYMKKPVIIPREKRYDEHINDHQLHFVEHFINTGIFFAIKNEYELMEIIKSGNYLQKPMSNELGNFSKLANQIKIIIMECINEKK